MNIYIIFFSIVHHYFNLQYSNVASIGSKRKREEEDEELVYQALPVNKVASAATAHSASSSK
jgi:hypothetical protein